eukprot:CAMPEP_0117421046 /NCGR_PEP_ID=MMETSP0758-20121206/2241_1 /TAXON_ID=63605 /ORGANISM="Percolomonas cosmopolitus, Strain AE-1 (ATCC 50343)" /LENGTH=239 /DNA_ID=CAMNT_0005202985 /DNA_START=316 /DNA_END=1032 /DNA_ORIENTATION=+
MTKKKTDFNLKLYPNSWEAFMGHKRKYIQLHLDKNIAKPRFTKEHMDILLRQFRKHINRITRGHFGRDVIGMDGDDVENPLNTISVLDKERMASHASVKAHENFVGSLQSKKRKSAYPQQPAKKKMSTVYTTTSTDPIRLPSEPDLNPSSKFNPIEPLLSKITNLPNPIYRFNDRFEAIPHDYPIDTEQDTFDRPYVRFSVPGSSMTSTRFSNQKEHIAKRKKVAKYYDMDICASVQEN